MQEILINNINLVFVIIFGIHAINFVLAIVILIHKNRIERNFK